MMIIKLLAVVGITASIGTNSTRFQDIKYTAPASYDLRISWQYYAPHGASNLYAYTSSGGGITQLVKFKQEVNYWRSYVENSFFASEFSWELRIYRSALNDALFTLYSGTDYLYNSPDGDITAYATATREPFRMVVSVLDSDYMVFYKRDRNNDVTYFSVFTDYFEYGVNSSRVLTYTTDTAYSFFATYSRPTNAWPSIYTPDRLCDDTTAFYFALQGVANIEGDDWWDIYNQGVDAGYDAGLDAGYNSGLDAGRLENTAWDDAFTIIKGAIDTVGDVMSISLFGPVTIGTLVSIPLIVGLLFWIIDKWRGS